MKSVSERISIIIAFVFSSVLFSEQVSAQPGVVSIQMFYDQLSPYGQWVSYPDYGYVWIPMVEQDFSPYSTGGHWCYTDFGWTWVSDYDWGWAPFHYGRWNFDSFYGWFWIPDTEWAPAWVMWRRSPGYYGWAPLGPGYNYNNSFDNDYYGRRESWVFAEEGYMGSGDINRHYAPRTNNETMINSSTVINNTYVDNKRNTTYISGPKGEEVEKQTGPPIKPLRIEESSKPGQSLANDRLNIYRPVVAKASAAESKPAPAKLVDLREVKSIQERNGNNISPDSKPAVAPSRENNIRKGEPHPANTEKPEQQNMEKSNSQHLPDKQVSPQRTVQPLSPSQQKNNQQEQQNAASPRQTPVKNNSTQKASRPKQQNVQKNNGKQAPVQRIQQPNASPKDIPR